MLSRARDIEIEVQKPDENEFVGLAVSLLKNAGYIRLTDLFYMTLGKYPKSSCAIYWTHYPRTRRGCTPHFANTIKGWPGVKVWKSGDDVLLQYVDKA